MSTAWVSICSDALRHNLGIVRGKNPHSKVMAVLKANAYGHGLVNVAKALSGADAIAVARLNEAVTLRDAGIQLPIVLLDGFLSTAELADISHHRLQPVIHTEHQLLALEQATDLPHAISTWLKVNTGMNRLGVPVVRAKDFYGRLASCQAVAGKPVLMTHLANADTPDTALNAQQISAFNEIKASIGGLTSISNSASALAGLAPGDSWIRPGLALYGVSPFHQVSGSELGLRPAMTLKARIIAIQTVKPGDFVGYGSAWPVQTATRIGIVCAGYGDGYPRSTPVGTDVFIKGRRYPIKGHVSMDMLTVDLGTSQAVQIGDEVELWGENVPVSEIAYSVGRIPYDLLCGVASRVEFRFT